MPRRLSVSSIQDVVLSRADRAAYPGSTNWSFQQLDLEAGSLLV
jgi:hypothetical protein